MNPFVLSIIGLVVGAAAGFFLGIGKARDADELTIIALREALAETQKALNEAHTVTAEAVAAQEQAESALKAAFERKSLAGKRAWLTRREKEEAERVKRIIFGDPDATDAPTSTMVVSDAGGVPVVVDVSDAA